MSTTRPAPHPAFWTIWIFWYVAIGYEFFAMETVADALAAFAALSFFFVPELIAVRINWRWTLSATMTWVVRKMSHHQRPFEGWNWLLVPAAVIPSLVMFKIGWVAGGWWGIVFASFLAIPSAVLCHQHWLEPEIQG